MALNSPRFRKLFRPLLVRAIHRVDDEISNLPDRTPGNPVTTAFFMAFGDIGTWQETKDILDLLSQEREAAGAVEQLKEVDHASWILNSLHDAVERYRTLGPRGRLEKGRIDQIVREVDRWHHSTSWHYRATTPLHGVVAPDPVSVSMGGFRVENLRPEEVIEFGRFPHRNQIQSDLIAVVRESDSAYPLAGDPLRFLQALQVVMDTPIYEGLTLCRPSIPYFGLTASESWHFSMEPSPEIELRRHYVTAHDIRAAARLGSSLSAEPEARVDLALVLYEQFLRSPHERAGAANIAMGLEALFLEDARDELRYRFSLYVSAWDNAISFRQAQRLYDARSAVIHGNTRATKEVDLLRTAGAALLRDSLLRLAHARERRHLRSIPNLVVRRVSSKAP